MLGAGTIMAIDLSAPRLAMALALGADHALDACRTTAAERLAAVRELTGGRGADVVIECAGVPGALASAVELSRPGGTVVLLGFHAGTEPVPLLSVVLEERQLIGSAGHLWDVDVTSAVALLSRGAVDVLPLLSAVVPLSDVVGDGFERLRVDRAALKILADPRRA
jgi:threonine dehydrogenase-like Zn-dependent dehydrogenase